MPQPSGRPTIADVAALAGVSRAAVSKVFNATGNISEATTIRIREAAAKLNWTPSAAAVALRRSRTRTVGLVLNRSNTTLDIGQTDTAIISGIETVLGPREWGLLLYLFDHSSDEQADFYRRLVDARRIDGLIMTNSMVGDNRFDLMRSLNMPAFLIGTPWNDDPIPHLDSDPPAAGIPEIVAHLLDIGHRDIAYVGGPMSHYQAVLRREAFDAELSTAGLSPLASVTTDYTGDAAAAATLTLLRRSHRPTAIVFGSDAMAIRGMRAAQAEGVKIPGELSVVGFEGLQVGEWTQPTLTTVNRHTIQRGQAAAARLLHLLGEDIETDQFPLRQPELYVRGSTAPPHPS